MSQQQQQQEEDVEGRRRQHYEQQENKAQEDERSFRVERARSGRAKCKKCKQPIADGTLRLAKIVPNPFGTGKTNLWYHVPCLFEVFKKQRPTTPRINKLDDVIGWEEITEEDARQLLTHLPESATDHWESAKDSRHLLVPSCRPTKRQRRSDSEGVCLSDRPHKDNSFRQFRKVCLQLAEESSYNQKTGILREFFSRGSDGDGFKGDLHLWCKLLLPGAVKRVYNLQSKQLVKLFSKLFDVNQEEMLEHLEQGDVAETVRIFFEKSDTCKPAKSGILTLQDVEEFLENLSKLTREEEQLAHFSSVVPKCTSNDLRMIIRLIKHDLRINAGPKHVLDAIDGNGYEAFQTSRNLQHVINQILQRRLNKVGEPAAAGLVVSLSILTPVLPMLAEACKSLEFAMKRCPNGMFAEVKYDGERVQLHKKGKEFKFFSRSLKPVLPHKVSHFEAHIPHAFPEATDLILDSEVLMVDPKTSTPLPFGTLGIHKKTAFKDAVPCLIVFDCLYYNGKSLLQMPVKERKHILQENMVEIKNHIMLPRMEEIHKLHDLENMLTRVLKEGLEGLVLKDMMSTYEPGKRRWLKVKKDYLFEGALADTADLVVLGAWYGTGNKGGMMSVFLMGCYDPVKDHWCTVTKVHGGHDDKTLERLQKELAVVKISRDQNKVPRWLNCKKPMIPDFIANDPKKMPVWEISGAEFTQADVHTANGISIRFPRVTRIREDKTWETATTLPELINIYERSKEYAKFELRRKRSPSPTKETKNDTLSHSSKGNVSSLSISVEGKPKRPLPNIFDGVKIHFPDDKRSMDVYRYFVAFGGEDITEKNAADYTTHHLISVSSERESQGTPVSVKWIWDSIRKQKLQDEKMYCS